VALAEVLVETGLPAIGHHHDFACERERFRHPQLPRLLHSVFPPALPGLWHLVINTTGARHLRGRRGIAAAVLPNVGDAVGVIALAPLTIWGCRRRCGWTRA
jgi:hypothetical protein